MFSVKSVELREMMRKVLDCREMIKKTLQKVTDQHLCNKYLRTMEELNLMQKLAAYLAENEISEKNNLFGAWDIEIVDSIEEEHERAFADKYFTT